MGVDCKLRINNEYLSLDRWYVFDNLVESGKKYSKSEALKIIRRLKRNLKNKVKTVWSNDQSRFAYHLYWIELARVAIEKAQESSEIIWYDGHYLETNYDR